MTPFYKNFRGQIDQLDDVKCIASGRIAILEDNMIEIDTATVTKLTEDNLNELVKKTVGEKYGKSIKSLITTKLPW